MSTSVNMCKFFHCIHYVDVVKSKLLILLQFFDFWARGVGAKSLILRENVEIIYKCRDLT